MKSALYFLGVALAVVACAAPYKYEYRAKDIDILNYALTLEHLEDTFYREGLTNFTANDFKAAGYDEKLYSRIKAVAADEATHVEFLTDAINAAGADPVAECTYTFGITDVTSFLATASVLEGVGVSAYLGAAADIMSKTYLTVAGTILTVEARHASYIRQNTGQDPFPQAFDNPLSPNAVFTLAAQFITSCPSSNAPLPVKAFPTLTVSISNYTSSLIKVGSTIRLATKETKDEGHVYAAFIVFTGPIFVDAVPVEGGYTVTVPEGVAGQSYVVLTSCENIATDDTIVAGPAIVEVY